MALIKSYFFHLFFLRLGMLVDPLRYVEYTAKGFVVVSLATQYACITWRRGGFSSEEREEDPP